MHLQTRTVHLTFKVTALVIDRRPEMGKAISYGWYYKTVKRIAQECGHKYLTPHSGRKRGMVAANATGKATSHDLQLLANMSQ